MGLTKPDPISFYKDSCRTGIFAIKIFLQSIDRSRERETFQPSDFGRCFEPSKTPKSADLLPPLADAVPSRSSNRTHTDLSIPRTKPIFPFLIDMIFWTLTQIFLAVDSIFFGSVRLGFSFSSNFVVWLLQFLLFLGGWFHLMIWEFEWIRSGFSSRMASPNMEAFDAYFQMADLDKDGRISGAEAVAFFQGSNLPKQILAQVFLSMPCLLKLSS